MKASIEDGWRCERRARVLEAAARVFSRLSYEQASMDEIAHEAGMGKPTVYRYFESKDALFTAVFVDALDALEARLAAVLDQEAGVEARLRGLVTALIPTFRDHLVSLRVMGEDSAVVDQSKRRIFRDRRARIVGFLAKAVQEGAAAGEVRWSVDPDRIGHLVVGMIWSATAGIRAEDDVIAGDVTALVLGGIGEPGAPARTLPETSWHDGGRVPAPVLLDDDRQTGRRRSREAALP